MFGRYSSTNAGAGAGGLHARISEVLCLLGEPARALAYTCVHTSAAATPTFKTKHRIMFMYMS